MTPAALARLHARAFVGSRPWSEAEFAALLDAPGTLLTGDERAFALGRVVADEAEVLTLATDPAHRRLGLARICLTALEQQAAATGASRLFLEVAADNAPAIALYKRADFAEIGRRAGYYARPSGAPAVDALLLNKALPSPKS